MRNASAFGLAWAAALLGGCATLRHGTTQQLVIATEPAGARCTVSRAGEPIGVVEPTPGTVELPRGTQLLEVRCRRDGYLEERRPIEVVNTAHLEAYEANLRKQEEQQAAAERWARYSDGEKGVRTAAGVGLVILALPVLAMAAQADGFYRLLTWPVRAVGTSVDQATAAAYQYETPVLHLVPESFADESARESFFAERIAQAKASAERARHVLDPALFCGPDGATARCDPARVSVDQALEQRLVDLRRQREQTRIAPSRAIQPGAAVGSE